MNLSRNRLAANDGPPTPVWNENPSLKYGVDAITLATFSAIIRSLGFLLILAAAGIAATLVIGLAGAALAGFIVSLAVAAVAVALFIRGLCLKNSPYTPLKRINTFGYRDSNFIDQQIEKAKTIEEKQEKNNDPTIKEEQEKNNQNDLNLVDKLINKDKKDASEKGDKNNDGQNLQP